MTDQKYKLVPTDPNAEMINAAAAAAGVTWDVASRAIDAAIAAAPEPVCKWASDDDGNWWGSCGQGYTFIDGGPKENNWNFCNYCGKKVEVVE